MSWSVDCFLLKYMYGNRGIGIVHGKAGVGAGGGMICQYLHSALHSARWGLRKQ